MDFESRFLRAIELVCISVILTGLLAIPILKYVLDNEGVIHLETRRVPTVYTAPKVKFIPPANGEPFKADISNAMPSKRSRQPVVISI